MYLSLFLQIKLIYFLRARNKLFVQFDKHYLKFRSYIILFYKQHLPARLILIYSQLVEVNTAS